MSRNEKQYSKNLNVTPEVHSQVQEIKLAMEKELRRTVYHNEVVEHLLRRRAEQALAPGSLTGPLNSMTETVLVPKDLAPLVRRFCEMLLTHGRGEVQEMIQRAAEMEAAAEGHPVEKRPKRVK